MILVSPDTLYFCTDSSPLIINEVHVYYRSITEPIIFTVRVRKFSTESVWILTYALQCITPIHSYTGQGVTQR